jgi:hypothetical protein
MKTNNLFKFIAIITIVILSDCAKTVAQEQLQSWGITSKIFDYNPSNPNVPTVTSLPTPTPIPGYPNSYFYSGTKAQYFQNSYTDCYGKLRLFVVDGLVYDGEGYLITDMGTGINSEVLIIPEETIPAHNKCDAYTIMATDGNTSTSLKIIHVHFSEDNVNFLGLGLAGKVYLGPYYRTLTGGGTNCKSVTLAASAPTSTGNIFVYAAGCHKIEKLHYDLVNGWVMSGQSVTFPSTSTDHTLRSELEIVKLSDNSYKAAHVFLKTTGGSNRWNLAVHNINNTGNFTGTNTYIEVSGTNWSAELIKGLEFSKNGRYIYYSQTITPFLWYVDLQQTPIIIPVAIPGISTAESTDFQDGQIERARDGKLYFVANNRLGRKDDSNNPSSTWTNSVTGTSLGTNFYPTASGYLSPTSTYKNRLLLDQLDGRDYGLCQTDNNDNCCNATTSWHEQTKTVSDPSPGDNITTWSSLTTGGNPYYTNVIRVKTKLIIPAGQTLNLYNLTLEFGKNAEIELKGTLNLYNTTLQSSCPQSMWKGVIVTGSGKILMDDVATNGSEIYDAIKAIDATGTSALVQVIDYSIFNRNEKHIVINTGNANNIIRRSTFNHTVALKDQAYGLDQSGGTAGTRYGITSVELIGCSNAQVVGHTSVNQGNTFNDGQYGVNATNSNVNVYRNTFNTLRTRGVNSDAQWQVRTINVTTSNVFNLCKTAIDAYFGTHLTVQSNTFYGGSEHGLKWSYNPGRILKIGDLSNAALGNNFSNQNWSCIFANDNANSSTVIEIGKNIINNSAYAAGIIVQETSLSGSPTFQKMNIDENEIGTTGGIEYGIRVTNVRGLAGQNAIDIPEYAPPTYPATFGAHKNKVSNFGIDKRGIDFSNAPQTRIMENEVYSSNSQNWQANNAGIFAFNSQNLTLVACTTKSATGIRYLLNMQGSNIACNRLDNCIIGIEAVAASLRPNSGVTHGNGPFPDTWVRRNFFLNQPGTYNDMRFYQSDCNLNKWCYPNTTSILYDVTCSNCGTIPVNCGDERCETIYGQEMLIGGGEGENSLQSDGGEVGSISDDGLTSNENMQWLMDYASQAEQNQTDALVQVVENPFIPSLLKVENHLSAFEFDAAREYFNQLHPVHIFEKNYYDVYNVSLAYRPEEPRELHQEEVDVLVKIAEQLSWEGGPAVFMARAILKFKLNMDFTDNVPAPVFYDVYKTDEINSVTEAGVIKIYPNPGKNEIFVTGIESGNSYSISDMQGRLIQSGSLSANGKIDTHSINAGIYTLNLLNFEGTSLYKTLWVKE